MKVVEVRGRRAPSKVYLGVKACAWCATELGTKLFRRSYGTELRWFIV